MSSLFGDIALATGILMIAMLGIAAISVQVSKKRIRRLAAKRIGEDIGTFAWKVDFRRLDTKVIRGVYEVLHTEMSNWLDCNLPLRPNDRLEKDLEIDEEDLADMADFLAESCGRTFENPELNPFYNRVDTVSDLIEFFCAQPKLKAT